MNLFKELRKTRILIIDDDKWIRNSLSMFFEGEGCRITACETAEEGFEVLESQDCRIIIADYRLPGMDGLEFFRHVQETHQQTLKILITAYGNQNIFEEAESIGVGTVIQKPFTVGIIKQSLISLLKNDNSKTPIGKQKT